MMKEREHIIVISNIYHVTEINAKMQCWINLRILAVSNGKQTVQLPFVEKHFLLHYAYALYRNCSSSILQLFNDYTKTGHSLRYYKQQQLTQCLYNYRCIGKEV